MKFGKIVKLGLFCFLLMNLCFAYAKDLEPQKYEEYVISDPQEPIDGLDAIEYLEGRKLYIEDPNSGIFILETKSIAICWHGNKREITDFCGPNRVANSEGYQSYMEAQGVRCRLFHGYEKE